ncbi:MAG: hypothetical protein K1000chlam4_01026, partial [Chlamydiae bacterium]|nr:hypothetical protein [Chlamydiota bacterium]
MPSISGCLPSCFRRSTTFVELDDVEVPALAELTTAATEILRNTPDFRERKSELKQIFVEMSQPYNKADEVVMALETLIKEIADSEGIFKIVERLVELMPVELLEKMLGEEGVSFQEFAKILQDDAEDLETLYKDSLPPDLSHRLSAIGSKLSDGAFQVLENAVMILGFAELMKPMESEGQKLARPQKVLLTITIYGALYAGLCGFLGLEYGAAAFAGFVVA